MFELMYKLCFSFFYSYACPAAFPSKPTETNVHPLSTLSWSQERMAVTALAQPWCSTRRWRAQRCAQLCRLYTQCTAPKHSLPSPFSPWALTIVRNWWRRSLTDGSGIRCTGLIAAGTSCMLQNASAWWPVSHICSPAGISCSSSTILPWSPHLVPCHWRRLSTMWYTTCLCCRRVAVWSSMVRQGPSSVSDQVSCLSVCLLLEGISGGLRIRCAGGGGGGGGGMNCSFADSL